MAAEALIVWVHPFNDGNGRTSRFFAKMIEDGPDDYEGLLAHTVSNNGQAGRRRFYRPAQDSRVGRETGINNFDIIHSWDLEDDPEKAAAMKARALEYARSLPGIVDATAISVEKLLEDEKLWAECYQKDGQKAVLTA